MHAIKEEQNSLNHLHIAETLQSLMYKLHLNEAELSRRTTIPQATLHKILRGKTSDPRISTLKILADFFGVTLDSLLSDNPKLCSDQESRIAKSQSIPIISWVDCQYGTDYLNSLSPNNHKSWLVTEPIVGSAFALFSKPSMVARFPKETVLVIDPHLEPIDGDLVIVHYDKTTEATIREISIDGPNYLLVPIISNAEVDKLDQTIKIIGVVIQSRFNYHQ